MECKELLRACHNTRPLSHILRCNEIRECQTM